MSGRKTYTLPDYKYNELVRKANAAEAEKRRAEAEKRAKEKIEKDLKLSKIYNEDLENRIKKIDKDFEDVKKTASDTKKQLIKTVEETNAALKKQEKSFNDKIANLGNKFADEMEKNNRRIDKIIKDNTAALEKEIDDLDKKTQKNINDVKNAVAALADKVGEPEALLNAGQDYVDIALELIEKLKEFRPEMFCPGAKENVLKVIAKAKNHIALSKDNIANASNALSHGEEAFEAAHKLYQDVVAAETLWQCKLELALEALAAAECEIEAREKLILKGVDENGDEIDVEFDTNHWSEGSLEELKNQSKKLRDILTNKDDAKNLTFEDLDGILDLANDIIDDSEKIKNGAYVAIELSEERAELADDLADDLAEQAGLTVIKTEGYEGDDARAANIIHLKNGATGFEVVITLKPDFECGKGGFVADTEIVNSGSNEDDASAFDHILKKVMGKYGLSGDEPINENPGKKDEIKNWADKEKAQTVSTVKSNSQIKDKASRINKKTKN